MMVPGGPGAEISSRELNRSLRATPSPRALNVASQHLTNVVLSPEIHHHGPVSPRCHYLPPDTTTYILPPPILSVPRNQGGSFMSPPCLSSSTAPHAFRMEPCPQGALKPSTVWLLLTPIASPWQPPLRSQPPQLSGATYLCHSSRCFTSFPPRKMQPNHPLLPKVSPGPSTYHTI